MPNNLYQLINKLGTKKKAKTYLEIMAEGDTFFEVNIPEKTVVNPYFQFEKSEHESENNKFFEVVSDIFFLELDQSIKYDLIFFNDVHNFEQTFRDFTNSLTQSNRRTLWVINNTFPPDIYASLKDKKEAIKLAKQAGHKNTNWCGDVYKLILAIHDFFPSLSYCTIKTGDNAQTLIWYGKRVLMPRFNDFEKISRLDYFTLQQHLDLMLLMPQPKAINLIGKSIKPEHFVTP
jgi:hypothetical protein